jgi:hypothetical protein
MDQRIAPFVAVTCSIGEFTYTDAIQNDKEHLAGVQAYTCFSLHLQTCTRRSLNFQEDPVVAFSDDTIRIGWKISPQV